jgi:hypothetical protein
MTSSEELRIIDIKNQYKKSGMSNAVRAKRSCPQPIRDVFALGPSRDMIARLIPQPPQPGWCMAYDTEYVVRSIIIRRIDDARPDVWRNS